MNPIEKVLTQIDDLLANEQRPTKDECKEISENLLKSYDDFVEEQKLLYPEFFK